MRFEWDPANELVNIQKHGIDFTTGAKVFHDQSYVLVEDRVDEQTGEQRWLAIRLVEAVALIVA